MLPLAHAGFAVAAGRVLARPRLEGRDLLWVGAGALLPDLLDKPLGFLVLQVPEGRLVGHAVVFAVAWLGLGYAFERSWRAPACLVGWGCLSHLLLDLPLAATLLWPFLGPFPIRGYAIDAPSLVEAVLRNPAHLAGEVAGAVVLALVAWRGWARGGRASAQVPG